MRTFLPALLSGVFLLLFLLQSVHAQEGSPSPASASSYDAVGEARVVGGNVVSARRQALARAQSAALALAIASVADPAGVPASVHQALLTRRSLIRTYRVLEEDRQGNSFRLKVAVDVDMGSLRRLLGKGGVKSRVKPHGVPKANRALALWAAPGFRGDVARALKASGYRIVMLDGPREQAQKRVHRKAAVVLFFSTSVRRAEGVRGLGLMGVEFTLHIEARWSTNWMTVGTLEERGWGAGQTAPMAQKDALARLLPPLLKKLGALLKKHARPTLAAGDVLVGVAGLQGLAEQKAICEFLRAKDARVCETHKLQMGRVWLRLFGTSGAAHIVRLLTAHDFSGFTLALERTQQQEVWLRVRRGLAP
ncbi:MAG: hypothetical protein JRH20_01235 [Deltaproteobacteria bacterium]|nr:hypothetical protein [Deltaproteobacteria bacterium]